MSTITPDDTLTAADLMAKITEVRAILQAVIARPGPVDTVPRPGDADRAIIRRAVELRDAIIESRETGYSGETDQRLATAYCVGAAGVLLGDLLAIIGRLDGAR